MKSDDLKSKLHKSRKENIKLRYEHAKMSKEILCYKVQNQKLLKSEKKSEAQQVKDAEYTKKLEKDLKHSQFDNEKL